MRTGRRDAAWRSLDAAGEPDVGIFEPCLAPRDAANLSRGDRGDERGEGALGDARLDPQHLPQLSLLDDDRVDEVECAQPFDRRRVDPEDLELDHAEVADVRLEVVWRAERDHAALVDDGDAVAELVCLEQVVRREDDRRAVFMELANDAAQLTRSDRVEADRRLVEEEDARPMQQRSGEMQPLLHAARVALDALVSSFAEVYESEQLLHPRGDLAWRDGIELSEVAEVVSTGEAGGEPPPAPQKQTELAADLPPRAGG